jgi:hypothetical protein
MEPFIRNDQYNYIKAQTKNLVNGHSSASDPGVLKAVKAMAKENVTGLFAGLSPAQEDLLEAVDTIKDKQDAEAFLAKLKPWVIPFRNVSDKTLEKLFPKVKKLKLPDLAAIDLREITYLGWNDIGQERKYIVADNDGKLIGLRGSFKNHSQKGICTICGSFENIGMFITQSKAAANGTYKNRGNYICQDSQTCNRNLRNEEKVLEFIDHLKNV